MSSTSTAPPHTHSADRATSQCMVVMYHYVHDRFAGADLVARSGKGVRGLSVAAFEKQLDDLTARLDPVGWTQFLAGHRGEDCLPSRSFLLTFDDGLREHVEIVLPILERRGLTGVFFVPGCVLTGRDLLTAHAVHLLLEVIGEDRLSGQINEALATMKLGTELDQTEMEHAQRIYHYEPAALARLKFLINLKLPLATRASVIRRLFEKHVGSQADWAGRWYLTPAQAQQIHAAGHTVGGHSFAHEPYGRLDDALLARDSTRCATALKEILGPGDRPFAYPFGSTHRHAAKFLGAAGFVQAFGTASTWATRLSPAMKLPRVDAIHVDAQLEMASK